MVLSFFHHSGYLPVNSKLERIITWKIQINGAFFQKKNREEIFRWISFFYKFQTVLFNKCKNMSDIISDMHSFMLVRLVRDFFRQAVHLAIEVQLSRQNNGDFQ